MSLLDEVSAAPRPEWTHDMVLDSRPLSGLARAFVCHHLVAHRLFHLVDVARVVAGELTSETFVRSQAPVILTMSKAGQVVLLRVAAGPGRRIMDSATAAAAHGTAAIGMLTLEWGVSYQAGEPAGLWAALDARHHRDAVESVVAALRPTDRAAAASSSGAQR